MCVDLIKLTIDGREVEVPAGTSVLDAAESIGIHIPRLCYDPCLSSVGACRICVVEIDGIRNLPASCVTWVAPGMVVRTDTPAVMEARKTILELLVANHPMDCMTCQKMGDCRLAEYCYAYGVTKGSFAGEEHHYDLEESNPFIVRDLNKCIVCGKCIRACAEMDRQGHPGLRLPGIRHQGDRLRRHPLYRIRLRLLRQLRLRLPDRRPDREADAGQGPPLGVQEGQDDLPLLRHRLQLRPLRQ